MFATLRKPKLTKKIALFFFTDLFNFVYPVKFFFILKCPFRRKADSYLWLDELYLESVILKLEVSSFSRASNERQSVRTLSNLSSLSVFGTANIIK